MSTGCEFFADDIVERAAGRLDGGRARRLDRHLAECADCAATVDVVASVRAAPVPVPGDLEARVRAAVAAAQAGGEATRQAPGAGEETGPGAALDAPVRPARAADRTGPVRTRRTAGWRPWAVPLAVAAAAAVVWLGVEAGEADPGAGTEGAPGVGTLLETDSPYGAWPAADGTVAGDPLLSDLSEEDLERLLEDMES
jgi:hypothetical protein